MGSLIRDKLWLGGVEAALDTEKLKAQSTTHILTVELNPLNEEKTKDFVYKFIDAEDSPEEDLLHHFEDVFVFIDDARQNHGGVLVHCFMGYSRSSTLVLSYLMRKECLTLKQATNSVMKARTIGPNPGFLQQLRIFERMGCTIQNDYPDYKAYTLEKLTAKVRECTFGRKKVTNFSNDPSVNGVLLDRALALDPETVKDDSKIIFRCRLCRRVVARDSSLLPHASGKGNVFGTRSTILNRSCNGLNESGSEVCQQGFFFEPVEWMRNQILTLEGKLTCPKTSCSAKLGNFNWVGHRCPCGHWVVPAFHLTKAKVDKEVVESKTEKSHDPIPTTNEQIKNEMAQLQKEIPGT